MRNCRVNLAFAWGLDLRFGSLLLPFVFELANLDDNQGNVIGHIAVPPRSVNCGTTWQRVRWSGTGNSRSRLANIRKASVLAMVRSPEFLVFHTSESC